MKSQRTYIKTYFYSPHEIRFINAMLDEAKDEIESIFLFEYDFHHDGSERKMIFREHESEFIHRNKIQYIPITREECNQKLVKYQYPLIQEFKEDRLMHAISEPAMRSMINFFLGSLYLENDIIIHVDADEVVYKSAYDDIRALLWRPNTHTCITLPMNQFFYKPNYLWANSVWKAPSACLGLYMNTFPQSVRNLGYYPHSYARFGAHYSWCMSIEEMIKKASVYGHKYQYGHVVDELTMRHAIENKIYPFDSKVDFRIEELSVEDSRIHSYMRQYI